MVNCSDNHDYFTVKDLARGLVEALHEPFTNESRWIIAEEWLQKAYELGSKNVEK